MSVKYPGVVVQLSGEDGNVFAVIGRVTRAMRAGGVPETEVREFSLACVSLRSYDDVLRLCMKTVEVL